MWKIIGRNSPGQRTLFERLHQFIIEIVLYTGYFCLYNRGSSIHRFHYTMNEYFRSIHESGKNSNNFSFNGNRTDSYIHVWNVWVNFIYINAFIYRVK